MMFLILIVKQCARAGSDVAAYDYKSHGLNKSYKLSQTASGIFFLKCH